MSPRLLSRSRVNLLFLSNLFPDATDPVRGLDNALLLEALRALPEIDTIRVLSPRPRLERWRGRNHGFQALGALPRDRPLDPIHVPVRYIPRIGDRWNDRLMARDLASAFADLVSKIRPDVVLASWLYPDGCAAASLCREANLPLVLITQGSDTHQYLNRPVRRQRILAACAWADAVVCRSGDLAERLARAGVHESKLRAIYNGVDTNRFRPGDQRVAREHLGLEPEEPLLLYVGNLLPVKNPSLLVESFADLVERRRSRGEKPVRLVMIGTGPLRAPLEKMMRRRRLEDRIAFLGQQTPDVVAEWMRAADLLCLSSENEGFPNVILEAMACHLPVVATDVGGIRERICHHAPARLVRSGDRAAFTEALDRQLANGVAKAATGFPLPEQLDWTTAAEAYADILRGALSPSCQR